MDADHLFFFTLDPVLSQRIYYRKRGRKMKNSKKLQIITTTSLIFTMTATMAIKPTLVFADEGFATAGQFTAGEIEEGEGTIAAPEQPADPVVPETPTEPTPAVPTTPMEPETPAAPTPPTPAPDAPVTPAEPTPPPESAAPVTPANPVDQATPTPEPEKPVDLVKYHSIRWEDVDGNVLQPYTIADQSAPHGEFEGYHIDHKEVDDNGNILYVFAKNAEEKATTKHVEIETGVRGNLLLAFATTIASLLTAGYLLVKKSTK